MPLYNLSQIIFLTMDIHSNHPLTDTEYYNKQEALKFRDVLLQFLIWHLYYLCALFPIEAMKAVGAPLPECLVFRNNEKKELCTIGMSVESKTVYNRHVSRK